MNIQEILIRKRNAIQVPKGRALANTANAMTLQAEVMRLGYILSSETLDAVASLSKAKISTLYNQVVPVLCKLTGADKAWEPFYPNFPSQVMEASDLELFFNAVFHYWSGGIWSPRYTKHPRLPEFEATEFKVLNLAKDDDLLSVFTELLGANGSISDQDRQLLSSILDTCNEKELKKAIPEIPFKENLCWFVGECIDRKMHLVGMEALKTATDVLRVATYLSNGDISLAENTKFRSFPRSLRRELVKKLNEVIRLDDIYSHRNKWIRLAHSLHIGEYAALAPRAFQMLDNLRNGVPYYTFNSRLELALEEREFSQAMNLLKTRPGAFARRLDHVLRVFDNGKAVDRFLKVIDKVDTRVLLQLYGHFNSRRQIVTNRVVFPKGSMAKAHLLTAELPPLSDNIVNKLRNGITHELESRFEARSAFGNVYIDPALAECPIPLNLRSASEGMRVVARGTKIPFAEDKNTIRMFIYWKGMDIDLSGFFVNEDFSRQDTIAYYGLRNNFSCHSGDIVMAPNGACEFIDVNIDKALKAGYRYLVMSVRVFTGPNFNEHDICYAGWMVRSKPKSNEIFDPKTVEQRVDLQVASKNAIPVIFDLKERKAIWLDVATKTGYNNLVRANNVHNDKATMFDMVTSAMNLDNKPNLYDLFMMHAQMRGDYIVEDPADADVKFGWNGDVTPYDTTKILAEYL